MPPTNLVYLSIGAISNYLHQLKYPSRILQRRKRTVGLNKKCCSLLKWIALSGVRQLLRPGLPYMQNASRTKEKQTLATPRCVSALVFNASSAHNKKTKPRLKPAHVTRFKRGTLYGEKKKRQKELEKTSSRQHSPAMKPSLCLPDF